MLLLTDTVVISYRDFSYPTWKTSPQLPDLRNLFSLRHIKFLALSLIAAIVASILPDSSNVIYC